ncbi:MAG: MoxR family ATPase [Candidatus Omnitrophica bacterium]|nr:MoxR family ATPase [Candidatus Omnitrophota bacterium]MBU1852595.1 MoxR family ATPase [Candidatus Omnitrophota bacterium]
MPDFNPKYGQDIKKINQEVKEASLFIQQLKAELSKVIVGQRYFMDRLLIALLANGHILIEGVPGLAKTLAVKTLSKCIQTKFQRIQFTPDLLPADLIGTLIYNPKDGTFTTKKGPIFSNLILADEINRAPAKVQSALLESMQERQVTIGDNTFLLDDPFLVLATQNPIEQEGTYPLPEAQVDRFMLKIKIEYPDKKEEKEIMERMAGHEPAEVKSVVSLDDIIKARDITGQIYMDDKVKDYIVDLVYATRTPEEYNIDIKNFIAYGASPRASIYLNIASKANAFIQGRGYVTPEDVKTVGMDILRHRVIVTYEAEAEEMTSEDVVKKVFDEIEVP